MKNDHVESDILTVSEFLLMYHHPDLAAEYLAALALLHELEFNIIDDQLSSLVSGFDNSDGSVVAMEVSTIFGGALDYALRQHGLIVSEDLAPVKRYQLLRDILEIADHEDKEALLDLIETTSNDGIECIVSLLEHIGVHDAHQYLDAIEFVADPFISNMVQYLRDNLAELPPIEIGSGVLTAKYRLSKVPEDVKNMSVIYGLFKDGLSLGYDLTVDTHATLKMAIATQVSRRYLLDEVRIFLLASTLAEDELRKYFNHIVENMLPDGVATAAMSITQVEYTT